MSKHEKANAWVTGTVGRTHREEVKPTRFEALAQQLGLDESQWVNSAELRAFARQHRDQAYIPETLLRAWHLTTRYDSELAPYSVVSGTVVPEQYPAVDDSIPTTV